MPTENNREQGIFGRTIQHPFFPMCFLTIVLVIMPFVNPSIYLSMDILIFGILAMGFNFIFGHMGLISFGHAMFFGFGAYTTGLILINWYEGLSVLLFGVAAATGVAIAIGYICLKKFGRGSNPAYLALTTLAFCQMFYFLVWSPLRVITGGSDGLLAIPTPPLEIPGLFSISLDSPLRLYFFVMVVFLICAFLIKRIIHSPFGRVIHGIRENELRVSFLGYNPFRFKLICFALSGLFGGVGGSLLTIRMNYVGLDTFHWLLSGEIIIMCLIGGMRTLWGPLVGSMIFLTFKDTIAAYTQEWMGFIAAIVIALVLFLPKGVWDKISTSAQRLSR
ncbi:MAG: branched-chain amino acid ABC transporter permease [Desulfatiglandaceae bacterium]